MVKHKKKLEKKHRYLATTTEEPTKKHKAKATQTEDKKQMAMTKAAPTVASAPTAVATRPDVPTIRFLEAGYGSDQGKCPHCMGDGKVGTLCFSCCKDADMNVGKCRRCRGVGILGEDCPTCPPEEYETQLEMGECPECGGAGTRYNECIGCEDQRQMYLW